MSQKGLLSDSELAEQVYKYFDIKLDRDALAKPTREMVMEVYRRFLDKIAPNWMLEDTVLSKMNYLMQKITQHFNVGYDFNVCDIVSPMKKRTITFFNVILYILAITDEHIEIDEGYEHCEAEKRDKNLANDREKSKLQVEVEELAFKVGQSKPLDQLKAISEEPHRILTAKKKECDEVEEEKSSIKQKLAKSKELIMMKNREIKESKEKTEKVRRQWETASEMSRVREKLETVNREIQQLQAQNDLEEKEANHRFRLLKKAREDFKQISNEKIKSKLNGNRVLKQIFKELEKKTADDIEMNNEGIRMIVQTSEDAIAGLCMEEEIADNLRLILHNFKINLNSSLRSNEDITVTKNSTFIKSKNNE